MNLLISTCTFLLLLTFAASIQRFKLEYKWTYINFTWQSPEAYNNAIASKKYIPENNAMSGIKYYKDTIYIAMPRVCNGTPATFGYINASDTASKTNRLITPFPDWNTFELTDQGCDKLESVQSMEVDADGILWILDGVRLSNTVCPSKIVLYDLNDGNKIVQSFTFPEQISLSKGAFLNDLVVDDSDGGFAYITDHSYIDPGIIIYSRAQNHAWKIRDSTMFAEIAYSRFVVDGVSFDNLEHVDGIALSPKNPSGPRKLYYCSISSLKLYSISTEILKDEQACSGSNWRLNVTHVATKQAQGDGMIMDNTGVLYYGLLPLYGVGKWNSKRLLSKPEIVDRNREEMIWADSFNFDDKGYLYLCANNLFRYFESQCAAGTYFPEVKFRIMKYYTGTQSYLY